MIMLYILISQNSDYTLFYKMLYLNFNLFPVNFYYTNTITIVKLSYYYEVLMNLLHAYHNYDFYLVEN